MTSAESSTTPTTGREWAVRVGLLAILVGLRWIALQAAGGLWRDEVHSVDMATGSLNNWFFALTNDSFPALWQVLLRGWIALCGSTDLSLRSLGFVLSLSVIPSLWWAARPFGVRFPWWSMVLLGMDPSLIVYGGEVRAYGLGVVTLLVLLGVVGRVGLAPTRQGWIALFLASLLAVHFSYTNCFMLAAILIAQFLGAMRRGNYRVAIGFLAVGVLAAASMIPYVLWTMPRLARVVHHTPTGLLQRAQVFLAAYHWGGFTRSIVWPLVGVMGVGAAMRCASATQKTGEAPDPETEQAYFLLMFAAIGTIGFWSYMQFLGVSTQHWYYLPFLALLAVTADWTSDLWVRRNPQYSTRNMLAAAVVGLLMAYELTLASFVPSIAFHFTTVDEVAQQIEEQARPDDLIVISPWYTGLTFQRYYHGSAPWIRLPNLAPDRMTDGYPEVHDKYLTLSSPEAVRPELDRIRATLEAGGRIWWVGLIQKLPSDEPPLTLTAAPDPSYGWAESAYNESWRQLAYAEARKVGIKIQDVTAPRPLIVSPHETPRVYLFEPTTHSPLGTSR